LNIALIVHERVARSLVPTLFDGTFDPVPCQRPAAGAAPHANHAAGHFVREGSEAHDLANQELRIPPFSPDNEAVISQVTSLRGDRFRAPNDKTQTYSASFTWRQVSRISIWRA